jgi:hypothetical protein
LRAPPMLWEKQRLFDQIEALRRQVKTSSKRGTQNLGCGPASRKRRPYRNLGLLEQ